MMLSLNLSQNILVIFLLASIRESWASVHLKNNGNTRFADRPLVGMSRESPSTNKTGCPNNLECSKGNCLPMAFVCDGTPDCPDGKDEKGCGGCRPGEFRCGNGVCIAQDKKCNREIDCSFGDDEYDCCSAKEFQCLDYACIPNEHRCNGKPECSDKSDEYNCYDPAGAQPITSSSSSLKTVTGHRGYYSIFFLAIALMSL